MGRHVVLNNIEHKDLKVITRYSAAFGYDVSNVLTFVTEFSAVHKEYPIFFHADPKIVKIYFWMSMGHPTVGAHVIFPLSVRAVPF
jgi:hypothetical protein